MANKSNVNESGFTKKEQKVMDLLVDAFNVFAQLEGQHPNEKTEFVGGIHVLQGIMATRILRRDYPGGWPTYKVGK